MDLQKLVKEISASSEDYQKCEKALKAITEKINTLEDDKKLSIHPVGSYAKRNMLKDFELDVAVQKQIPKASHTLNNNQKKTLQTRFQKKIIKDLKEIIISDEENFQILREINGGLKLKYIALDVNINVKFCLGFKIEDIKETAKTKDLCTFEAILAIENVKKFENCTVLQDSVKKANLAIENVEQIENCTVLQDSVKILKHFNNEFHTKLASDHKVEEIKVPSSAFESLVFDFWSPESILEDLVINTLFCLEHHTDEIFHPVAKNINMCAKYNFWNELQRFAKEKRLEIQGPVEENESPKTQLESSK